MASLYLSNYDASSEQLFFSDLEDKDEVLLLESNGAIVGFTTLQFFDHDDNGRTICVVYSGDTIVNPLHWGQQSLAFAWITRIGQLKKERRDVPLYWLLLVKGHRTYKYLHTFGRTFHPHWSSGNTELKTLADALARERFGSDYNPATGIVEFKYSRGQLKPSIAAPTEMELKKESVRFFLARNPNYLIGHELVCLCQLSEDNMKPLTKRLFLKGLENGYS